MHKRLFILVLLILGFASCRHTEDHDTHDHDEVFLYLTAYNSDFELFVEADPFSAGQYSKIFAHFTRLSDFRPLDNAVVTLNLETSQEHIRQTVETAAREGIYVFELEPVMAGKAQLYFDIKTPDREHRLDYGEIVVHENAHDAIHEAEDQTIHDPNAILFGKEQSWRVNFATDFPRQESFGQIIRTMARVEPAQDDEVVVVSKTGGLIQFCAGTLVDGMPVVADKALMNISSGSLADHNMSVRLAEARNNFEKSRSDLERVEKLAEKQIVSERELLQVRADFENARLVYENLSNHFNRAGQTVSSPVSGVVKKVWVKHGQYAETGQPLFSVMQNKRLLLHADVSQRYIQDLQSLATANIRFPGKNEAVKLEQLGGRIISVGKAANDDNFLIPIHLEVKQTGDFLPGGFVEVFLVIRKNEPVLSVPQEAILEEQDNYYVFLQLTPEQFVKREVRLGATDGVRVEILEGLKPTERIVTRGAIWVKLAQSSTALDPHAGHVH